MSRNKLKNNGRDHEYGEISVSVENIGGIEQVEISFRPGITILTGRNATNRTSLIRAIAGGLGGSTATIKSDAESGCVALTLDDETYVREYTRKGNNTVSSGNPYTEQSDLVDLFVCLLEENPIRRAIERGDDLREVIMRPIDTERIRRKQRELERDRDQVKNRIEEIEQRRSKLPELEEQRRALQKERDETAAEISELRSKIDEHEADKEDAERAESLLDDLESLRQQVREKEDQLDHQRSRVENLRSEKTKVETELESIDLVTDELDTLEEKITKLENERRRIENTTSDLTRIIEFNDDVLTTGEGSLEIGSSENDPISELNPKSQTVECWTCGSQVNKQDIEERLDGLRDLVEKKRQDRKEIIEKLETLEDRQRELRQDAERIQELETERDELRDAINRREKTIDELEKELAEIRSEIASVEEEVNGTEELRDNDLGESYHRLSELEYERGQIENELSDIDEKMSTIKKESDERDRLEKQLEEYQEELESLRSHVQDLERGVVNQFNDHMEEVLDLLGYENLSRVWIERKITETSSRKETTFKLHIVRQSNEGTTYEDVIDHVSESEREVIGLVVALAGYLVHDVHEQIPFVLLDSLESIDAERIAALVQYFAEYSRFLIVPLLPEDANVLSDEYGRIPAEELNPG